MLKIPLDPKTDNSAREELLTMYREATTVSDHFKIELSNAENQTEAAEIAARLLQTFDLRHQLIRTLAIDL